MSDKSRAIAQSMRARYKNYPRRCLENEVADTLEQQADRIEKLEAALVKIATSKYCQYEHSDPGQYGIGVTDGHRWCAQVANDALAAPEQSRAIADDAMGMEKWIEKLQQIIAELYDGWPEPMAEGIDGFELQDFGERHGILLHEARVTPCCDHCNCAEYVGYGEETDCWRIAPEFRLEKSD